MIRAAPHAIPMHSGFFSIFVESTFNDGPQKSLQFRLIGGADEGFVFGGWDAS